MAVCTNDYSVVIIIITIIIICITKVFTIYKALPHIFRFNRELNSLMSTYYIIGTFTYIFCAPYNIL